MDKWLETKQIPNHLISASGFVFKDDKVLMVKSPSKGWQFPGGIMETGENIIECLKREIFEESGIVIEPVCLIGIYQRLDYRKGYGPLSGELLPPVAVFTFKCKYIEGIETTSDESIDVRWFEINEAKNVIEKPYLIDIFEHMLNYDGRICFNSFIEEDGKLILKSEDLIG